MPPPRKSLRAVKTMAQLTDGRRTRTPAGALMEMSVMASEKARLQKELERSRRRHEQIEVRLGEIAAKEQRLQAFITILHVEGSVPIALPVDLPPQMTTREFSY